MKKIVNGNIIDMTTSEIEARQNEEQNNLIKIQNRNTEKNNKETKKASAKSKLLALGLTEEEIKLTFGI